MTIAPALYSSEEQTWNSPEVVLERVRLIAPISLDPCSNDTSIVGAAEEWRIERGEDGLARPWKDIGLNFCNPPYSDLVAWARKMSREASRHCEIVALIPARTDTVAFQDHVLPTPVCDTCHSRCHGITVIPIDDGFSKFPITSSEQFLAVGDVFRVVMTSGCPELKQILADADLWRERRVYTVPV